MTEPRLLEAALELFDVLKDLGRPGCLIGGLVVARWGDPRATRDVDATVLAELGEERLVLDGLTQRLRPRDAEPNWDALVTASNGLDVDVSLAVFPFEREVIDRATGWHVGPDREIRTCSAEDLILYKLVAARTQDLADVESVVRRQGRRLDLDRIRRWGAFFAETKEDPDLLQPFERQARRFGLV